MNTSKRLNPKIISLIVIVLIAAGTTGVYALNQSQKGSATATAEPTSTSTSTSDDSSSAGSSAAASSSYKDGTYTETGKYNTPGGSESVTVVATLANGTVTNVSTTGSANGGSSERYQEKFLSAYKTSVVGKTIDSVSLSRVAGSSLTSNGFNKAIEQIKSDASQTG